MIFTAYLTSPANLKWPQDESAQSEQTKTGKNAKEKHSKSPSKTGKPSGKATGKDEPDAKDGFTEEVKKVDTK